MWNAVNIEEGALPPYYIPADWVLCDGTSYGHIQTPDLRDKFIIGVGANSTFNIRDSSGSEFIRVNNLPSHTHSLVDATDFSPALENVVLGSTGSIPLQEWDQSSGTDYSVKNKTETAATGGNQPYYPKCYALCYIMYLP
jgi:microcystin-dependent protein